MRTRSVIGLTLYITFLLGATAINAATLPPITYEVWFWDQVMNWRSYSSVAMAGLIGGVVRTVVTLRGKDPTLRVALETIGDAITSLIAGFVVWIILLVYQSVFDPLLHTTTFLIAFIAGFRPAGFFAWFEHTTKRVLAASSDGIVNYVKNKADSLSKPVEEPAKDVK